MFCYQKRCKVNTYFLNDKIFLTFFLKKTSPVPIFNISLLFLRVFDDWCLSLSQYNMDEVQLSENCQKNAKVLVI